MIDKKYIAIEGAIGVGKTTLAKKISDTIKCETIFEDYVTNPFLKDFYDHSYLNSAICLITTKSPIELIESLLDIELKLGRKRSKSNDYIARLIDLDVLLIEGLVVNHPRLKVPHPLMNSRRFVLQPLADIAPDWIHEVDGISISDLLLKCDDQIDVTHYGKIPLHSH